VSGRGIGVSVRQRLLKSPARKGRPFQELLQYFAMERFLFSRIGSQNRLRRIGLF